MAQEQEIRKLADLTPDSNNYNKGTEKGRKLIGKSLKKLGAGRSILIDKDGNVIAGNKTLEGAAAAGIDEVIVVKTTGRQIVAVQRTDLEIGSKKGREMALADNATGAANLSWDLEAMTADGWTDKDLEGWGVDMPEAEPVKAEAFEDDFEPPAEIEEMQTDIVLGDLFEIGPHKLLCGDSTKAEDVERLMGGEKADICVTDPPYGVKMDKGFEGFEGFGGFGTPIKRRQYTDDWDSEIPDKKAFDLIFEHSKVAIIFGGNFFAHMLPQSKHWIFWDKKQTMPTFGDGELCWTNVDRKSIVKIEVVYNGLIGKEKDRFHPTQKPVKIVSEILERYSELNALCIDFFCGSGTTMVSADQLGRRCRAMEISPKYCQVILDRMLKLDPNIGIKKNGEPYNNR